MDTEKLSQYLERIENMKSQLSEFTEESTKTALIMPFFAMLGYDVFNANEFMPEFTCDVATKKGEKVDYAILKDGDPIMLIEVKRAGMKLQKQQQGQLFRYFSTSHCRIGILTNGIIYQFFSDLNAPNIMDDEPFFSFNLLEDDPAIYISSLQQFSKDNFSIKSVISKAVYQKYSKVVQKTLENDLVSPSDEIVKYFLSRPEVKTGNRITAQMIEKYREATKEAMQKFFGTIISEIQNDESENSETTDTAEIIAKKIKEYCSETVKDCQFQTEDCIEFIRIHIYTSEQRKFGVVKIQKSDLAVNFRKLVNGKPEVYDLKSIDELRNYM